MIAFLALAMVGGSFWGLHYLRGYSSADPVTLPLVNETTSIKREASPFEPTHPGIPRVGDWKSFQEAAQRGDAVMVALSADEINRLLAESSDTRGKVFVSIDGNIGRVQMSFPLQDVPFMKGRHLNGELKVQSAPDGDPAKVRIFDMRLNGQSVPEDFLDRTLFGYPPLRVLVTGWIDNQRIETFRIENGCAIGESCATL
ncbi:MAG: hypothetical protein ABI946_09275 [Chthoniobacterales bacterium]